MNDFSLYKLPILDVIYLQARDESTASTDLNVWRRALCTKAVVTFAPSGMTCHSNSDNYNVSCIINIESQQSMSMLSFSASFELKTLQLLPPPAEQSLYGARITNRTKIVYSEHNIRASITYGNWSYSFVDARMDPREKVSISLEQQLYDALPKEVVAAASGVVSSTFNRTDADESLILGTLLLCGASGSGGKTLMQSLSRDNDAHLLRVSAASFYAGAKGGGNVTQGWAEKQVREVVLCALSLRRCVLLFEDLHFLTPAASRDVKLTEAEEGVVEGIYQIINELRQRKDESAGQMCGPGRHLLLIVGCAHDESLVHLKLREAFCDKVHIPLPSARERRRLMRTVWEEHQHKHQQQLSGESQWAYPAAKLDIVADSSAGMAVIPLLCAYQEEVQALTSQLAVQAAAVPGDVSNGGVNATQFQAKQPFAQVAGLEAVKRVLQEAVLWPRQYAHLYRAFTARAAVGGDNEETETTTVGAAVGLCAGILLFGPPGTGKTLLPRALSEELGCSLVNLRISDVVRGEIGTSEKRVVQLFQEAKRCAPSVLFIDEFQALFTSRAAGDGDSGGSSLTATLAGCFDDLNVWNRNAGAESLVTVLASTNEPWAVDPGFLRPGRLDKCVFVGPLNCQGRLEFLANRVMSQSKRNENEDKDESHMHMLQAVATATEGFTGADLTLLLSRAQDICAMRARSAQSGNTSQFIEHSDFQEALRRTQASTCSEDILDYTDWISQYPYLQ